jgi:hypothetical protein
VTDKPDGAGVGILTRPERERQAVPTVAGSHAARLRGEPILATSPTKAELLAATKTAEEDSGQESSSARKNHGRVFQGFEVIHSAQGFPVREEFKYVYLVRAAATHSCLLIKMQDCIIEVRGARARIKQKALVDERDTSIKLDPHPEMDHGKLSEMHITYVRIWEGESVIRFNEDGSAFVPSNHDVAALIKKPANE